MNWFSKKNVLSNEVLNELLENKKELETIAFYYRLKRKENPECVNHTSSEVIKFGCERGGAADLVFSIIEKYFEQKNEIDILKNNK